METTNHQPKVCLKDAILDNLNSYPSFEPFQLNSIVYKIQIQNVFISNQGPIKGKIITMISIWIPSPRFLSSDGFLFDLPEPWDVRALSIRSAHLHVSWLSDFIFFYPKPFYKSLHQSFFYSFITILPSESGATLHYSTILPQIL